MEQYSIDDVELSWASINLKGGAPQGSFVQESKSAPRYTKKGTGTGRIIRIYNPDRSGSLTINLEQTSATHKALKAVMRLDDLGVPQVFPLVMKDTRSGEKFIYTNAYIEAAPDEGRGTEAATYPWTFGYERKEEAPLTNLNGNVVGT